MKTNYKQLDRIVDLNNLKFAWKRIYRKDSAGGLDQKSVQDFAQNLENELKTLRDDILEERYTPTPLLQIKVDKNKPGQKRKLGLPSVRDKVAQEAVRSVIEPVLDKNFSNRSYGYRTNKGPQKGIRRVAHILNACKAEWVVLVDIDEFFPSIDHSILLEILEEHDIERPIINMLLLWLKMGTVNTRMKWQDVYHGVSQGGVVSPLLANSYLHRLDFFLEVKNIEFVRYADDIRLFARSREEGQRTHDLVKEILSQKLRLNLNELPEPVQDITKGFSFLGIHFKDSKLLIDPDKWSSFEAKIHKIIYRSESWEKKIAMLNNSFFGWNNYYGQFVVPEEMGKITSLVQASLAAKIAEDRAISKKWTAETFNTILNRLHIPHLESKEEHEKILATILSESEKKAGEIQNRGKAIQKVEKTVRKQKRQYTRCVIQTSHLLVTTPGIFIGKSQNRIYARKERKNIFEVPLNQLESITLLTRSTSFSSDLVTACAAKGISICWIGSGNKVEAVIHAPQSDRTDLHIRQLAQASTPERQFSISRFIIQGKIKNQINLIKYFSKYEKTKYSEYAKHYFRFLEKSEKSFKEIKEIKFGDSWEYSRGVLLSIEGRMAAAYWDIIKKLLAPGAEFTGRERKGAKDLVNSLLNYGYALLRSQVLLELHRNGLNPNIGFLHTPQKGKDTLTFDLMEIFRAQAVDRVVISELRRNAKLFGQEKNGLLNMESRKRLVNKFRIRLAAIEKFRKQELRLEEIIRSQAKELKRHVLDQGKFRPYIGKW